jgi:membrane glycosyltransferase
MIQGILPYHGRQPLELAILIMFAILFAWISAGFWTALAGFATLALGRDRNAITRTIRPDAQPSDIPHDARTAIVMPICNEDVPRVFAGLRATYESLATTGALDRFDFFILSDSVSADKRVEELVAWIELCRAVNGFGRLFYRWRQHRIKRKSGNIADFCRRWGRKYRYMVVLDADSVMSGECLTRLVLIAEANLGAGIIQTVPRAAGRDTLFARVQQFATAAYGPVFTAGLHYWQLGESHYWGHNAIIRVAPFMKHCALGRLRGHGALSGEILSHDFVEAALMRRAGWSVWIAYDLPGSFEEMPPNLVDELARDHRWCQGNLMNMRLLLMKGLHPAHRAVFMTGVMAYLSAPLWFLSLILATVLVAVQTLTVPQYFVQPFQLFPLWPEWHPERAVTLFSATALLLFLPKILASLLVEANGYGGRMRLALSVLIECAVSVLLAPVRMLFHTQFVVAALMGRAVRWRSPARAEAQTDWTHALRRHSVHTMVGIAWIALVWSLDPHYLPWLLPVVGALILSIPLSVYTSRAGVGRAFRRRGVCLIPEETHAVPVLLATRKYLLETGPPRGVVDAVVDPLVNALICAHGVTRGLSEASRFTRRRLVERALYQGIDALTPHERGLLVGDPEALTQLHSAVWTLREAHPSWNAARGDGGARSHQTTVLPEPSDRIEEVPQFPVRAVGA